MASAKTRKVMDIETDNHGHFICIMDTTKRYNPYILYATWWETGWHRKKLAEYANADSVLWHILNLGRAKA